VSRARELAAFIEEALGPFPGATFEIVRESKHPIVALTYCGKTRRMAVTNTPSDHRSRLNDRSDMRRMLRSME
jgi:hypothetical protein